MVRDHSLSALPTTPQVIGLYLTKAFGDAQGLDHAAPYRLDLQAAWEHGHHLDLSHPAIRETFAGIKRRAGVAQTQEGARAPWRPPGGPAALPPTLREHATARSCWSVSPLRCARSELVALDVARSRFTGEGVAITIPPQ